MLLKPSSLILAEHEWGMLAPKRGWACCHNHNGTVGYTKLSMHSSLPHSNSTAVHLRLLCCLTRLLHEAQASQVVVGCTRPRRYGGTIAYPCLAYETHQVQAAALSTYLALTVWMSPEPLSLAGLR